jgi:hypothetical protein
MRSILFDTVRLGIEGLDLDTSKLKLRGWSWFTSGRRDCEGHEVEQTAFGPPEKIDYPHYLRYYPASGTLKLETSLPKLHFRGENVSLLAPGDVNQTLDDLSNRVADIVGEDVPHVGGWNIRGRCDAVFAWDTRFDGKNHVGDYLHAFKTVELARHYCQAIDREATLYWRNGARVIRMYDKEAESKEASARGLLRFEVQLNHAKKELTDLGAESVKTRDVLNWKNASAVLHRYLDGLGADLVIRDDEKLFQFLRDKVGKRGKTAAFRLMGYVSVIRMYSRDELIDQGYRRETLWRYANEISKAGASVASSKSGLLRPLTLPDCYDGHAGRLK